MRLNYVEVGRLSWPTKHTNPVFVHSISLTLINSLKLSRLLMIVYSYLSIIPLWPIKPIFTPLYYGGLCDAVIIITVFIHTYQIHFIWIYVEGHPKKPQCERTHVEAYNVYLGLYNYSQRSFNTIKHVNTILNHVL